MTSGGHYRTQPIGYASGGLLPNCLTVAILLLLRDAHRLNASAITRTAHSAIAGLFVGTREISPTSRSSMQPVMFRALAMR
jgi:hypothetical protein